MLTGNKFPGMTKAWNALQGGRLSHSEKKKKKKRNPPPPWLTPSPSLWRMFLLGNWCKGAIDKKEWNIKPPPRGGDRLGGGGGGRAADSNILRAPAKGINPSFFPVSVLTFFCFSFPPTLQPSISVFFILTCVSPCVNPQFSVYVCVCVCVCLCVCVCVCVFASLKNLVKIRKVTLKSKLHVADVVYSSTAS